MAIYAEMPDGVRLEFPDGTSPDVMDSAAQDYLKSSGMLGKPVAPGISNQPAHETMGMGDVLISAGKNFIPSAIRAGEDIASMVMHPVDTAEALGGLAKGVGQKTWRGITGGSEKGDSEKYADAAADYFAERYGSLEGFKQALAFDPVGVISDASMLFTGGAGAAKAGSRLAKVSAAAGKADGVPNRRLLDLSATLGKTADVLGKAGEWTDPLMAAGKTGSWATSKVMRDGYTPAMRLYQAALKPNIGFGSGSKTKYSNDQVFGMIREALDRGIPVTDRGARKAGEGVHEINSIIDAAIEGADNQPFMRISPDAIADAAMQSEKRAKIAASNSPTEELSHFDSAVEDYRMAHGGDTSVRAAQEGKKATYEKYAPKYQNNAQPTHAGKIEAEMEIARNQRQAVADAVDWAVQNGYATLPKGHDIHSLNQAEGRLIDLRDAVARSAQKGGSKSLFSILPAAIAMAGTGDLKNALLAGLAVPVMTNPGVQSYAAIGLDRAGKALRRYGSGLHDAGAVMYGTGRNGRANADNRREDERTKGGLLGRFGK